MHAAGRGSESQRVKDPAGGLAELHPLQLQVACMPSRALVMCMELRMQTRGMGPRNWAQAALHANRVYQICAVHAPTAWHAWPRSSLILPCRGKSHQSCTRYACGPCVWLRTGHGKPCGYTKGGKGRRKSKVWYHLRPAAISSPAFHARRRMLLGASIAAAGCVGNIWRDHHLFVARAMSCHACVLHWCLLQGSRPFD